MAIFLVDETLRIEVRYEPEDEDLRDNICLCILEDCPDEERLFRAEETNIYLTARQARELAEALLNAAEHSLQQGMD
ncbi:MAG TPA: hypothetical protein VFF68_04340 [Anaerolineaceae bacterium]|nr:hypothetical protein [Anaerolineaceae bacterium]